MCGIVSMILKDTNKVLGKEYVDMFKQMLYADAVRGWDSTGIAAIRHNDDVMVVKEAMVPHHLFEKINDDVWAKQNRALIGHNRWATKGEKNRDNAHPFNVGSVTLVHNGTLRFHHHLKNVDVDSHAIAHAIEEKGAIPALEVLDGAYALVWHDNKTKLIHATRNYERPLHLLETEDLYLLVSEEGLGRWICSRFQVNVRKAELMQPGWLYTFRENRKGFIGFTKTRYEIYTVPFNKNKNFNMYDDEEYDKMWESYMKKDTTAGNKGSKDKQLPAPVSQVKPYTTNAAAFDGLYVGKKIEVLLYEKKQLQYSAFNLGKTQWVGESFSNSNVIVEVYTDSDIDFTEHVVEVIIERMYHSPSVNENFIIAHSPAIQEKKTADADGPITSSNGVRLTDQVINIAKNCQCLFCSADFVADKDIALIPVLKNGHLYKYHYYCPNCSHPSKRQQAIKGV